MSHGWTAQTRFRVERAIGRANLISDDDDDNRTTASTATTVASCAARYVNAWRHRSEVGMCVLVLVLLLARNFNY